MWRLAYEEKFHYKVNISYLFLIDKYHLIESITIPSLIDYIMYLRVIFFNSNDIIVYTAQCFPCSMYFMYICILLSLDWELQTLLL